MVKPQNPRYMFRCVIVCVCKNALRMARELQVSPSSTTLRPLRGGRTSERTGMLDPLASATGADGPCRIASLTASCAEHISI